ncbi:uncharacterized protein LOC131841592 [Achroia grisella]|uniref:uncharacterized protein LOC131841592 n=1 Tax=Achroia grisella TaxID=688607 RepID=UPI0027D2BF85|nr:uncharacterized protein LOC131841592 [Achroia grisella]
MKLLKLSLILTLLQLCQTLEHHGVRKKRNHEMSQVVNNKNISPVLKIGRVKEKPRILLTHNIPIHVLPQNIYNLKQKSQIPQQSINNRFDKDVIKHTFIPLNSVRSNVKMPLNLLQPKMETNVEKKDKVEQHVDHTCKHKKQDYFEDDDSDENDVKLSSLSLNVTNNNETIRYAHNDTCESNCQYLMKNIKVSKIPTEKTNSAEVKTTTDNKLPDSIVNIKNLKHEENKTIINVKANETMVIQNLLDPGNQTMNSKNITEKGKGSSRCKHAIETPSAVGGTEKTNKANNVKFVVNIDSDVVKSFECDPSDRIIINNHNYEEIIEKEPTAPTQIDCPDVNYSYIPEYTYGQQYLDRNGYQTQTSNSLMPDTTFIKQPYEYPFANEINFDDFYKYKQDGTFSGNYKRTVLPNNRIWRKWKNINIYIKPKVSDKPVNVVDPKFYKISSINQNYNNKAYQKMNDNNRYGLRPQNNNMQMSTYPCYFYRYK